MTGEIIRGKTVRLGYLHQGDAGLDPALTPREAVTEVRGTLDSAQGAAAASQLLDRLGLRGDTQWTPAGELSGGERRRLQLLRILVDEPNVLFLDEPTNDLDVDTLTELEDLLDGWPGSLVLVSHDRYFLERVTDHVVALLGDGSLSFLPGGVDEYLRRRLAAAGAGTQPGGAGTPPGATAAAGGAGSSAVPGRRAAGGRAGRGRSGPPARRWPRLERQIDRLTTQENKLTAALAENATDYVRLTELGAELRAVQDEKSQLEEQWLEAPKTLTSRPVARVPCAPPRRTTHPIMGQSWGGARRPAGRAGPGAGRPESGGRPRSARSAARARCAADRPGPRRPGPPRPGSA